MQRQAQMAFIAIIFIFASASIFASQNNTQVSNSNFSIQDANKTIASTYDYVSIINASGYLIFAPNLTLAYAYLNKSMSLYKTSPASAIFYAGKAREEADRAYAAISGYRTISLGVVAIFTLALGAILYRFIRTPLQIKTQRKTTK